MDLNIKLSFGHVRSMVLPYTRGNHFAEGITIYKLEVGKKKTKNKESGVKKKMFLKQILVARVSRDQWQRWIS